MSNLKSVVDIINNMKRIALLFFIGFTLVTCNNPIDDGPEVIKTDINEISLKIHIPANSLTTYAVEDASLLENGIDSIFIDLYQGASPTPIHRGKFGGTDLKKQLGSMDSIIVVSYEVDNITTGTLRVEVFANRKNPTKIAAEVPVPNGNVANTFFMSGEANLTLIGASYAGDVHIVRNVAKLRTIVTKSSAAMPLDLIIDYNNIKIQVINTPDSTTLFGNTQTDPISAIGYFNYTDRTVRMSGVPSGGGLVDSLYMYENFRSSYPDNRITKIKITIPTQSATEGNKVAEYTYPLYTIATGNGIIRNYIYTLDISIRGQSLDPLILLDVRPWDDVNIDGSIGGTYLTLDKSEIVFNSSGEALINFCTDAQAIYFNFTEFNTNNVPQLGNQIKAVGIDTSLTNLGGFPLAPTGYKDAQIIVDKQHCGSFGFKLDLSAFPGFPNVKFGGKICIRAGNIVKCLSFPGRSTYDAHFIVGDSIFPGEKFTNATVQPTNSWIEVSNTRLFTTAVGNTYSGAETQIFLHLNENLGTAPRDGKVTLINTNTGVEKTIEITQLHALPVGRFGYSPVATTDNNIYSTGLFTEQLYEYYTMPTYTLPPGNTTILPSNALYNGRFSAINASVFDAANYNSGLFDYHSAFYEVINYCAYKNRPAVKNAQGTLSLSDIKWYLPSQAQLMAMWVSYESFKNVATSNFTYADLFWSSTDNTDYAAQAQYIDFRYGNVAHHDRIRKHLARCVRDNTAASNTMINKVDVSSFEYPRIYFDYAMPDSALTTVSKNGVSGHESNEVNRKLYMRLRPAKNDLNSGALVPWALNVCSTYSEEGGAPAGSWRLPTQRELQALWILQNEIKSVCPSFNLLTNEYYWSGTDASTTSGNSAWILYGGVSPLGGAGNVPHWTKSNQLRVRCVHQF